MDTHAESEFFRPHFLKIPVVSYRNGLKTISMMNEHSDDSERFVSFENDGWRFDGHSGPVAVSIPIRRHRQFSELAVLVRPGNRAFCYAARLAKTDRWLHFNHLHSWMYPLVEELLGIRERYAQITELVAKTHRLTQ